MKTIKNCHISYLPNQANTTVSIFNVFCIDIMKAATLNTWCSLLSSQGFCSYDCSPLYLSYLSAQFYYILLYEKYALTITLLPSDYLYLLPSVSQENPPNCAYSVAPHSSLILSLTFSDKANVSSLQKLSLSSYQRSLLCQILFISQLNTVEIPLSLPTVP